MTARLRAGLVAVVAAACALAGAGAASARPLHIAVRHTFTQPPTTAQCLATVKIACYQPSQFQQAYDMKRLYAAGLDGRGRTIVIVDSFGSPTIQHDLAEFDTAFGLPAPPSFNIITPVGAIPPYDPGAQAGWAFETSLDVEYAHAMAPGANILLVETPVAETEGVTGFPQIVDAENYVINHNLGDVISQSFGATEETFPNAGALLSLRSAFKNAERHHVTVLAASGDAGSTDYRLNGVEFYEHRVDSWPSTDPLVTSVGGTQLHLTDNGTRLAPDNVWNDTALLGSPAAGGGGLSAIFRRPFYQDAVANVVGDHRGTPDISMSAAVNGGALVYGSFRGFSSNGQPGFQIVGGTSEATPLFSGVAAILDQAKGERLGLLNPALYGLAGHGGGIVDITAGNNTVFFKQSGGVVVVPGFDAVRGYDLASGLGTVDGRELVTELTGH